MIKSVEFRKKRDPLWKRLEFLLDKTGKNYTIKHLSPDEIEELTSLYRLSVSSLSVARSISLDQNLLDYLQALVTRAYFCIYGIPAKQHNTIHNFFVAQFPSLVRKYIAYYAIAFAFIIVGMVAGFWATYHDPGYFFAFVEEAMAEGRTPFDSRESLETILMSGRNLSEGEKTLFWSQLFSHNTKVGFMSFSLGIGLGLPTIFLMVYNGGSLGAMAAAYSIHDLSIPFWAWILPHGITEFLAVILCAGSGLILAFNLLRPGIYGRWHNLKLSAQDAGLVVIGSVPLFFLAGYIESFFRQSSLPNSIRYLFALITFLFWFGYFSRGGQNHD